MKKLEDLIAQRLYKIINYVLSKLIKPDTTVENVRELDLEAIKKLKAEYGIQGIILDVDETLRRDMKEIPECNK